MKVKFLFRHFIDSVTVGNSLSAYDVICFRGWDAMADLKRKEL